MFFFISMDFISMAMIEFEKKISMVRIDFPNNKHGKVIFHLKIGIIYLIKLKNLTKIVLFFIFWTNFGFKA